VTDRPYCHHRADTDVIKAYKCSFSQNKCVIAKKWLGPMSILGRFPGGNQDSPSGKEEDMTHTALLVCPLPND